VLAGLLAILYALDAIPISYNVNDDPGQVIALTGLDGFPVDPASTFLSPSFAHALAFLYRCAPGVSWYGIVLCAANCVAVGLFARALLPLARYPLVLLVAVPPIAVFLGESCIFITFTQAMLFLLFGVLLNVLRWALLEPESPLRPAWLCGCLLASYALRVDAFLLSAVFALPVALAVARSRWRPLIPLLAIVTAAVTIDFAVTRLQRKSADEVAFAGYQPLRARFSDYPATSIPEACGRAGWSPADYDLFACWFLYDNAVFNKTTLASFQSAGAASTSWIARLQAQCEAALKTASRSADENHRSYWVWLAACMSMVFLDRVTPRRIERTPWYAALALVVMFSLIIVLGATRLPRRVCGPMFCYAVGVQAIWVAWNRAAAGWHWGRLGLGRRAIGSFLAALLACPLCLFWEIDVSARLAWVAEYRPGWLSGLTRIQQQLSPHSLVLMLYGPDVINQAGHPLHEQADLQLLKNFVPSGWAVNSPRYCQGLRERGYRDGRDLLQRSIDNPEIFYLCLPGDPGGKAAQAQLIVNYASRHLHHKKPIGVKIVGYYRVKGLQGFCCFRLVSQ
jgi:hypothetical protein